nr:pyrokinin-1 receptor-like [Parasteatoda tepidariorum]
MISSIMNVLESATSHLLSLAPIIKNETFSDTIENHENNSDDSSYFNYFEDISEITWSLILMTILYSVLLISGVLGNICTCVVIYRNRYMHTATNYYLFSLAISDLLLLVMSLPQEVYDLWVPQPYPFGDAMCVVRGFTAETSTYASILTITAFTVERYIAICHPLKSHKWSSLSRALKVIMFVWIVSLVCAIPVSFQFGVLHMRGSSGEDLWFTAVCTIKRKLRHAFLISSLIFFWLPQAIILVLYVKIGLRLRLPNPMAKAMVSDDSESMDGMKDSSVKMTQSRKISMINNRKGIIKMLGQYLRLQLNSKVVRVCFCDQLPSSS